MAHRDTIVVGASAGGVEALRQLVGALPADLPACMLVVLHTGPSSINALAAILARTTSLSVIPAERDLPIRPGSVVVARPDHHLLVLDGHVVLSRGPRENGHRPSIDVLFRSAARVLGPRVIGVVLSGSLDDGSAGLVAIRRRGGIAMVQDPADALTPGMPNSAIAAASPEFVLPVAAMPAELTRLVAGTVTVPDDEPSPLMDTEIAIAGLDPGALGQVVRPGSPAGLSCPDCHGTLFEIDDGGFVRYRCRVGHAWSAESLLAEHDHELEGALWMALRGLEEKAALATSMADRAAAHSAPISADRFRDQAREARRATELIRRMLLEGRGASDGADSPGEHGGIRS